MSGKIKAAAIRENKAASELAIANDTTKSKSARIRELAAMGVERSTIANLMGIRYQHVRNVLVTKVAEQKTEEAETEQESAEA